MSEKPFRYRTPRFDSARWEGFPFRRGDIVINARSKSGTTWVQMICALLIFQTPELPAPLSELSPYLDWLTTPRAELYERLSAQEHRRFVKTHTPMDGIPLDSRVTYVVIARHPLDIAVSLYHHYGNVNHERILELIGEPASPVPRPAPRPLHEWLRSWIDHDGTPRERLESLAGVIWHLSDAWARRRQPNVVLMHYDDLSAELECEMRRLAALLGITVRDEVWPSLVKAATFEHMRANADRLVPGPSGVIKDSSAFFRQGTTGSARELLADTELAHYQARAAHLASPDFLAWLHGEIPSAQAQEAP